MNPSKLLQHHLLASALAAPSVDTPPVAVSPWYRGGSLAVAPIEGHPAQFWLPREPAPVLHVGHRLGGGVQLYLPDGEDVTRRHRDDVATWLEAHPGAAEGSP